MLLSDYSISITSLMAVSNVVQSSWTHDYNDLFTLANNSNRIFAKAIKII